MKIRHKHKPYFRALIPTAAALWVMVCLVGIAGAEPDAATWPRTSTRAIGKLLGERQFKEAITWSRGLVDSLVTNDTQGADLARGLETLARSLRRGGQASRDETLEIARRAVATSQDSPPAEPDLQAACLNTLGLIHLQRSEFAEALPPLQQATRLWAASNGPNDQRVAAGLNNQGLVLKSVGRNDEARLVLEQAAAIYETRRDEPQYLDKLAGTTMSLAQLHLKLGQYDLARERGERALAIYRSTPGGDHPQLGAAMGNMAALYRTMGDFDRAEEYYEAALPLIEAAHGPEYSEVGRILNNLGNLRADRGDIAAARSCFERALVITEKAFGPDAPTTGVRLLNLGSILADLGDFEQAETHLRRSKDIFENRLGPDHLYMGFAEQALGPVLAAQGEPEAGLVSLTRARDIFTAELGPKHLDLALVLGDMADIQIDQGQYTAAGENLTRGLEIVRAELGTGHPEVVRLMRTQGRLALAEHDAQQAEALLREALQIGTKALGAEHPELAALHLDLARAQAAQDRLTDAFAHALAAERLGRNHFALAALAFEERRALQFARRRTSGLGLATALAFDLQAQGDSTAVAQLWAEVVRSRALVLDLMGSRQRHQQQSPATAALVDSLTEATGSLARLFVRGVGEDTPADYRAALLAARSRREDLERRLAATSLDFARRLAATRAGWAKVNADLPPDATLVSYITFAGDDASEVRIAALVSRPVEPTPQLFDLGPAPAINTAVADWRQVLVAGPTADGEDLPRVTAECRQAGRHLATLVWDPLALPTGEGRIYIVPVGALALVDFPTLPRTGGGYLIENEAILLAVSAERDLLQRATPPATGGELLVMGGMDFGANTAAVLTSDCRDYAGLRFANLAGSLHEARTIADLWADLSTQPVRKLTGAAADEQQFKALAPDCEVVHLATHGFFLDSSCDEAANGLVHPLLLSGLAFSSANLRGDRETGEDGILTAYEVAGLDLSGNALAILSACDTGQGEILTGEGVFGLQRAFALAGTRSLIMSLSPVNDQIAVVWMEHLYRNHLEQGLAYPAAAREASRRMLAAQRARGWPEHPFTWAPFVQMRTGS